MSPFLVVLAGAIAVVLYDTAGSFLSRFLGFNYAWLTIGSILIYGTAGILAERDSLLVGVLAAVAVGVIDGTVGWYISWVIGPGRPKEGLTAGTVISAIIFVATLSAISGTVGALVARALELS